MPQKLSLQKCYDEAVVKVSKNIRALQMINMMIPVSDQNQSKILEDSLNFLEPFWNRNKQPIENLRELLYDIPLDEEWSVSKICTYIWSLGIIR